MELDKLIADQKKRLASISAQQATVKAQIAVTQKSLDEVSTTVDSMQSEIVILQIQVDQVQLSYDALASEEKDLQAEFEKLEAGRKAKQDQLDARQEVLARRLVAAYKTDQTPLLAQIMSAGSLSDALSDVSYLMELGAQDAALAEQIRRDREALVQMQQQVETSRQTVSELTDQVGRQKAMLDGQMNELNVTRSKLVTMQRQLDAQIAKQKAADAKLAKNKAALAAAIKSNGEASAKLADKINKLAADQGLQGPHPVGLQRPAQLADGRQDHPGVRLHRLLDGAARGQLRPLPPGHRSRGAVPHAGLAPPAPAWCCSSATTPTTRRPRPGS